MLLPFLFMLFGAMFLKKQSEVMIGYMKWVAKIGYICCAFSAVIYGIATLIPFITI